MSDQLGWRGFTRRLNKEASSWAVMFPQFPRLMHHALIENRAQAMDDKISELLIEQRRQSRLLAALAVLVTLLLLWQLW